MSASLGHKGKIHFFLKSGLFCRNSYTLPEPEFCKSSLRESLHLRFLMSLCCLVHTDLPGHPWRRRVGWVAPEERHTCTLRDTRTLSRRCHHPGGCLRFLCPALSVLWLLFHFLSLLEVGSGQEKHVML